MMDGPASTTGAASRHEATRSGFSASRLLILAVSAYIALAASGALQWYMFAPAHDEQRAAQLVLLWLTGLFLCYEVLRGRAREGMGWLQQHPNIALALAIFFGIGVISAVSAVLPAWAFLEWAHLFLLVVTCVALSLAIARARGAEAGLYLALVTAAVLYAVPVMVQYCAAVFLVHSLDNGVVVVGLDHRRFAAQMHAMLIPMLGALYFQYNGRYPAAARVALFALAGFAWMLCFIAASRGAAVALLASVFALALLGRTAWLRWMKFYGVSLLIGALLCVCLFVLLPAWLGVPMNWENRLVSTASSPGLADSPGRMFLWRKTLQLAIDSPLIGVGPMHFALRFHNEGAHPHNLILQLLAEWGPLAMLCLVGVLLFGYFHFGRYVADKLHGATRDHGRQCTAEGLWAVLTIIAVYSMIDGLFVMPYSQMLIVFFSAWAMALTSANVRDRTSAAVRATAAGMARRALLAIALAIALVSIAISGLPAIAGSQEREEAYLRSTHANALFPRFWIQGWIGNMPAGDTETPPR